MSKTIFYSWQSDLPSNVNRSFIEVALKKAVSKINKEDLVEEAERDEDIELDKDTKGVTGIPPIADTIFDKISQCSVFVPDLTFVGITPQKRLLPNPNVLIEYGYAFKEVTPSRMVPIMNTAFGEPSDANLPFNMRHRRNPLTYHLEEGASLEERKKVRDALVLELVNALKPILESESGASEPFQGTKPTLGPSIFWSKGEDFLGPDTPDSSKIAEASSEGQHLFLHLIPNTKATHINSAKNAAELSLSGGLMQMCKRTMGRSYRRNRYGASVYEMEEGNSIWSLTQLFMTGELWGIEFDMINKERLTKERKIPFGFFPMGAVESIFNFTLANYLSFMNKILGLQLPLRYRAGATNVYGYKMATRDIFDKFQGSVVNEHIEFDGKITSFNSETSDILRPFFEHLYEECGLDRSKFETS